MEGDKEVRGEGCAGRRGNSTVLSRKAWLTSGAKSRLTDHEIVTEFCWNGMGLRIKLEWNMKFCHWNGMEIDQEIL